MATDGDVRGEKNQKGYIAGSRALDSLDRLITSTESFFHPSNSGPWTNTVSGIDDYLHDYFSSSGSANNLFTTSDL